MCPKSAIFFPFTKHETIASYYQAKVNINISFLVDEKNKKVIND